MNDFEAGFLKGPVGADVCWKIKSEKRIQNLVDEDQYGSIARLRGTSKNGMKGEYMDGNS